MDRVNIGGVRHTQRVRLLGHELCKFRFTASNYLRDNHCRVVCRLSYARLDSLLFRKRLICLKAEFRWKLQSGEGGDRQLRVEPAPARVELLEANRAS
jgi:hypothetical protein